MSGRQGGGRRARDTTREEDMQVNVLNDVLEGIRKAKDFNDESARLGQEIIALEEEIKIASTSKSRSGSAVEDHRKLDDLYRKKLRCAESERKVHEEYDIANKLAILASMRDNNEPAPSRAGQKAGRGKHKPIIESDVSVDGSGGVSPAETTASTNPRVDVLKRKQSHGQRGSTPSGPGRPLGSGNKDANKDASKELADGDQPLHKGVLAEKAGELKVGTEVFYRLSPKVADDAGVGIQCIIKKVHVDRKPVIYDVMDPEPDSSGKQSVHRATAKDLYPIPSSSSLGNDTKGTVFQVGQTVFARYPDTDTFYRAKVVRSLKGGEYTLRFEGEEDDTEKGVERRFVLDPRMR